VFKFLERDGNRGPRPASVILIGLDWIGLDWIVLRKYCIIFLLILHSVFVSIFLTVFLFWRALYDRCTDAVCPSVFMHVNRLSEKLLDAFWWNFSCWFL